MPTHNPAPRAHAATPTFAQRLRGPRADLAIYSQRKRATRVILDSGRYAGISFHFPPPTAFARYIAVTARARFPEAPSPREAEAWLRKCCAELLPPPSADPEAYWTLHKFGRADAALDRRCGLWFTETARALTRLMCSQDTAAQKAAVGASERPSKLTTTERAKAGAVGRWGEPVTVAASPAEAMKAARSDWLTRERATARAALVDALASGDLPCGNWTLASLSRIIEARATAYVDADNFTYFQANVDYRDRFRVGDFPPEHARIPRRGTIAALAREVFGAESPRQTVDGVRGRFFTIEAASESVASARRPAAGDRTQAA